MANYNKSFNFRNGVQVDNDNFIVNSNGLVGIGTTIPTDYLDVYGTSKFNDLIRGTDITLSGTTSSNKLIVGLVSITSGIITASSGIVTYYGDGGKLINLPTSQWIDVDPGFGFESIYSAGNVGIATTNPQYTFQIGGNPNTSSGVGFNSTGDIKASGIITAYSFSGFGTDIQGINASNISNGILNNSRLPQNINVSGIITAYSFSGFGTDVQGVNASNITNGILNNSRLPQNISVSGIITASTNFRGNITGNLSGNVNSTGLSTFSGGISGNLSGNVNSTGLSTFSGGIIGNVTGIASTARSLTGTPDISVGVITATTFTTTSGRIGIGTNLPTSELEIRSSSNSLVQIISNSGQAIISIGQTGGTIPGEAQSIGLIRYGNSPKSFDIVNNDSGDLNSYLHAGPSGINTGSFKWIYGQTFEELMSLTYTGRLGIGITNPQHKLHVVGTSTVTSNSFVGGNLNVAGTITGTLTLPNIIASNINATTGISTTLNLEVQNILTAASSIGIGTTNPIAGLDARQKAGLFGVVAINTTSTSSTLQVVGQSLFDNVGIGTTSVGESNLVISDSGIRIEDSVLIANSSFFVGIGTTTPRSAFDLADAGNSLINSAFRFMLPPIVTTTERTGLSTIAGAFIFNKTTNKFQGFTGIAWTDFH
jgi:hypothetical protein